MHFWIFVFFFTCINAIASSPIQGQDQLQQQLRYCLYSQVPDVQKISNLIQQSVDLHKKYSCGGTPIHFAANHGTAEVMECMINYQADINSTDICHDTPLHWAVEAKNLEAASWLIDNKAKINAPGGNEMSPLHWAALNGDSRMVKLLLKNQAIVDLKDRNGLTPLSKAADRGKLGVAKILIEHEADVNASGISCGWSPLHHAADHGDFYMVQLLINHGADINTKDLQGRIPLDLAKETQRRFFLQEYQLMESQNRLRNINEGFHGHLMKALVCGGKANKYEAIQITRYLFEHPDDCNFKELIISYIKIYSNSPINN